MLKRLTLLSILSESKLAIDEQVLDYKLMACTVSDDNENTWDIILNDGSTYSYYALGNVILTKTFLKMMPGGILVRAVQRSL